MIISRTPFRISFFGGGTDYPVWYREHGGSVLATTIDKYCYISLRTLPPFFEYKTRVVYSREERVASIEEIRHPAAREALRYMDVDTGLEIHHDGDLPARTGLGSSSAFTVGLLHALCAWKGRIVSKMELAREAIKLEQEMIREHVGSQDQVLAAFGGFNRIDFLKDGEIRVKPVTLSRDRLAGLQDHLMMFYTGLSRTASEIAAEQVRQTPNRAKELNAMAGMVDQAERILAEDRDLTEFGGLLHEGWMLKRGLTSKITTPEVDEAYEAARRTGALGGKLLGAGGGGFLLLFVPPGKRDAVRAALKKLLVVPVRFEHLGSQIIFYEAERPGSPA